VTFTKLLKFSKRLKSIILTEKGTGDVTRIIGQVVTGVGFLRAGIIFKEGTNIHGLTTAVTVWCCSAVGCLAGAGHIKETFIGLYDSTILKTINNVTFIINYVTLTVPVILTFAGR